MTRPIPSPEELALLGVVPGEGYYEITFTADANDRVLTSVYSHFVGWADEHPTWELREASLVDPARMIATRRSLGTEPLVVNELPDLVRFCFLLGGVALVRKELADKYMPETVQPRSCIGRPSGGFEAREMLGSEARARFAKGKLRMEVFKRDRFRCRICGRSSDDALDVKLHAHHVREHSANGPTVIWNLATVCEACHDGIQRHDRDVAWTLGSKIDPFRSADDYDRELSDGIQRFRRIARDRLEAEFKRKHHGLKKRVKTTKK